MHRLRFHIACTKLSHPGSICLLTPVLLQIHMSQVSALAAMHDPVIAADGHTYERHAMEHWLLQHGTSPITGAQLGHLRLVPNVIVRSIVRTQQQG